MAFSNPFALAFVVLMVVVVAAIAYQILSQQNAAQVEALQDRLDERDQNDVIEVHERAAAAEAQVNLLEDSRYIDTLGLEENRRNNVREEEASNTEASIVNERPVPDIGDSH